MDEAQRALRILVAGGETCSHVHRITCGGLTTPSCTFSVRWHFAVLSEWSDSSLGCVKTIYMVDVIGTWLSMRSSQAADHGAVSRMARAAMSGMRLLLQPKLVMMDFTSLKYH